METVVDFDAWKSVFGESLGGDISGALGTYKLGVFVSNLIIDTGDFVKQTSYTKGYAELADLFQNILQNDKWEFNRNMSKENAWKFFEDYTILWELRYQGESQYLKASKIKVLFWDNIPINNYGNKEQVVKDIQQILENSRFFVSSSISVPDSVQYITKAVICCPVDVYVYASDGTLLAKLEDGVESDTINEYGRFAVVYNPCTDEYDKVIAKSTDDELNIKMVSIDDGLVNYNLIYKDSDGNIQSLSFDNKDIYKGDIISVNTNDDKYYVDRNGDGKIDETVLLTKNNNEYIKVDGISVTSKSITLHVGETAVINANVTPENASYKLLNWNSSDDSIVEVKNGKIIANSIGSAEITSTATDNQSVTSEVKVTVIESDHDWSDWSVTKSATESDEGLETRTCKNDSSHIETRSIPKLTHTHKLIKVDAIEATCTEKGNIEYWTCSDCEKLFSDETAMTEINVEDTVITEHGHKYGEWTVTIPATCETDGEELQVCSYDTNHKESRLISAIDHDWNEGVVTKEATSTEDGELTYTCQNDSNHVKTEIIPATEKNDDNSSSDTDVPTNDESSNSSSSNSDSSSAKDSSSNNNSSDSNSSNNSSSSSSNSTGNDKGNGTAQGNNSINTSDSTNPNTGDIGAAKFLSFSALMLGIVTVLKKKKQ
jgi:uncharacterized protein YjdB